MQTQPKTRKGQATKHRMIEVAAQLIHRNGVNATTVNDILDRSDTGKSQFSHYFGSKEQLIQEVIKHHIQRLVSVQIEIIEKLENLNDIDHLFDYYRSRQREFLEQHSAACPIGQMILEVAGDSTDIRIQIKSIFDDVRKALVRKFEDFGRRGLVKSEANPQELANFLIAATQGGFLLGKTEQSTTPIGEILAHCKNYLMSFSLARQTDTSIKRT